MQTVSTLRTGTARTRTASTRSHRNTPVPMPTGLCWRCGRTRWWEAAGVRTFADVTEHVQAGQALERSQLHLRALFDAIPDRVWLKDTTGRFIMCNPAAAKALGHDPRAGAGLYRANWPQRLACRQTRLKQTCVRSTAMRP